MFEGISLSPNLVFLTPLFVLKFNYSTKLKYFEVCYSVLVQFSRLDASINLS